MEYTEDQLTEWSNKAPTVDGVYETSAGNFAYWSKEFGWGGGRSTKAEAEMSKENGYCSDFYHAAFKWRGLNFNPSETKPAKKPANKRKTVYRVYAMNKNQFGYSQIACFDTKSEVNRFIEYRSKLDGSLRFKVLPLRFRTQEA